MQRALSRSLLPKFVLPTRRFVASLRPMDPSKASAPVKSENDKRIYRHFTLPNALRVLIYDDPEGDREAAAMSCKVGQLCDPPEIQGLAHFCEHMLFMGTKKYPSENEYEEYVDKHGGSYNAYTASEETNYFFSIAKD